MEMDVPDFPYRAEYAKSGRAACRGCKSKIEKDELRLAVMIQSPVYDGKMAHWHHFECFFRKQRPKTSDDIAHFESLRIEDQIAISGRISGSAVVLPDAKGKKGRKRDATAVAAKRAALKDFKIDNAVSSRAMCRGCEIKIMKDEVRIAKKDYETDVGKKYGGQDMWYHLSCFAKLRAELGYFESADKLPGFKELDKNEQQEVRKQLPAIKQEDVPDVKKLRAEDEPDSKGPASKEEKLFIVQNKLMYKYRDLLKDSLKKKELVELLEENGQEVPAGVDRILDRLSDIMTFGALESCSVCESHGQFVFSKIGYMCQGNMSEWTKCVNVTKDPKRRPFIVPEEFKEKYDFLANYKYTARKRVFKDVNVTVKKEESETDGPKIKRELPPLYNMEFVILGRTNLSKDDIKKQIVRFGGKVTTKIHKNVMAVISNLSEVDKMNERMRNVKETNIHVVGEDFLNDVQAFSGKIPDLVVKKTICDWGSDPNLRMPPEPSSSSSNSFTKSRSIYTSSVPSKMKLKLKNGSTVDPETGLEDIAHIYEKNKDKYCVTLTKFDLQTKKNSYYKLQLLEGDHSQRFWVYRAWGRIGTTIGGTKLEKMSTLNEAIREFCTLYQDRTGNDWFNRDNFVKMPQKFHPVDVDYSNDLDGENLKIECDNDSTLPSEVQNLIKLIFDIEEMKKLMLEFELDMEKMPVGKLSRKQIQTGYGILKDIEGLLQRNDHNPLHFLDLSNRFYTLIPHNFGVDNAPIINNLELLQQKLTMLDNLLEIEVAYNLMKTNESSNKHHSVDEYYNKLNTEIQVLEQTTEEFDVIKEYVANTHGETHRSYELVIDQVFAIKRKDELKRFKPFKKLHNRKLLWHGSRLTNYVGILSNGLKIAPPDAPVSGYMFGKGIYFADMVSKSANYCGTNPSNSTGLLLLCEVALGEMYERTESEYVTKLPKGKHSTKGVGRTQPDPNVIKQIEDGIEVPLGKGKVNANITSSLLYNEYIVYDVAQVNIKYLVKTNFKYKY